MLSARCRGFCRAVDQECGGQLLRWATLAQVARRLKTSVEKVTVLAGECAEADYVRLDVKGPPYRLLPSSAILTEQIPSRFCARSASVVSRAAAG
jgi:hypothetical protein